MLVIVTNHWKENLEWLKKSKFSVILIDKVGSDPSCFEPTYIIPNKGGAESSYFKYIIENYDNLPDNIAFLHGHETAYHQVHGRPLLEVIEAANLTHGYIPINGWVRAWNFNNEEGTLDAPRMWDDFHLPEEDKPENGSILIFEPNSQFIVSRDRIRRHSKELYQHMYDVLMNEEAEWCPHANKPIARHYACLENIFHIIFGEKPQFFYKPDFFNFSYVPESWHKEPAIREFIQQFIIEVVCYYTRPRGANIAPKFKEPF